MKQLLISLLAVSAIGLALACSGTQVQAEGPAAASSLPPPTLPTEPFPSTPPTSQPSVLTAAPRASRVDEVCGHFQSPASRTASVVLPVIDKMDADLDKEFAQAAKTNDVVACRKSASTLSEVLDNRYLASARACGEWSDELSKNFFLQIDVDRKGAASALEGASANSQTLKSCRSGLAKAKEHFDRARAIGKDVCALDQLTCKEKAKSACTAYFAASIDANEASQRLSCVPPAEPRSPSTRDGTGTRDATERSLTGGALESAILTGAADFFAERAEKELSLFAAEILADKLCGKDSSAREYLPKTCELLKPCVLNATKTACDENQEVDDPVIGPTPAAIRAAAKADLLALPYKVAEKLAKSNGPLGCAVAFSWKVADEVAHGAELEAILKDPSSVLSHPAVVARCGNPTEDTLAKEIKSIALHIDWILSKHPRAVGAIREGAFRDVVALDVQLNADQQALISEILRRLRELDEAVASYKKDPSPEARVRMTIAAMQVMVPIMTHLAPAAKDDVYASVELFSQLLNRDYAAAVVSASKLSVVEVMPANTRNLVSLGASLAQAESSDDVRQTFEDAALSLGSWRRKNVDRWGGTLTGFVGLTGGFEYVNETLEANREVSTGVSMSPALLVGADLHHGLSKLTRLGLHISVLDLGALATIRLDNPEVKDTETGATVTPTAPSPDGPSAQENPDVRIEQVLAPGAFAYVGFGPIAIGPAVSYVPSLRAGRTAAGDIKPLDVVRVGLVAAVDVSVLPLF